MFQFMKDDMPESGKTKCDLCGKDYAYFIEVEDHNGNITEAALYCSACMNTVMEIEILPPVKGCVRMLCDEQ